MIPLTAAVSGKLTWSKIQYGHELRLNGDAVASLSKDGFWSTTIGAKTHDGHWIFRRSGCLGSGTEIMEAQSKNVVATFKGNWSSGGELIFSDGQAFRLAVNGWWRPVWSLIGADHQPVFRIDVREKTVEMINPAALAEDRLTLAILLAWHRVQRAAEDAAATAVMVAAIS